MCDRAAEHGLDAGIEFLPWTGIRDAATAAEIARRAGRANGGIVFDTWHHFRGTNDDAALARVPGEQIKAVQLNSAPEHAAADLMTEAPGSVDKDQLAELHLRTAKTGK